jgi:site-specific DNA recombinase
MTTATTIKIKHVAMYLRISQEKRGENVESLANHRSILTEFAKKEGYTYETYEEVLSGGASELEERPQLQKLLNNIEKYDAILVVELSRLSRNGYISELVLKNCQEYDKPIVTPVHTYDLANNNNDVLTFRFGSLIASQEHALIGKRSKNNKIAMAKQGLHISGNVPFGYIRNNKTKKLEINEAEAATIRYIFKLHSEGLGAFKIRDILNTEGYKSATGKAFNLPSVKRIIRNPAYKGWTIFNDRKKVKKNGKWTYEILDTIICKDAHPPIIDPKVWDEVNRDREERAEKARIKREKPAVVTGVTMLKDLIVCAVCDCKMTIRKDNKLNYYSIKRCEYYLPDGKMCCNRGIKLDVVEKVFLEYIKNYKGVLQEELKALEIDDISYLVEEQEEKLANIDKRIKEITFEKKNLLKLATKNLISEEEFLEERQTLEDELEKISSRRETLIHEMENPSIEDIQERNKNIIALIQYVEKEKKPESINSILKLFVKKVYYSRVIPHELLEKSTQNPERKNYPFHLEIEYF